MCVTCGNFHTSLCAATVSSLSRHEFYWFCKSLLPLGFVEPRVSHLQDKHADHYTTAAYTMQHLTQFSGTQHGASYWPHYMPLGVSQSLFIVRHATFPPSTFPHRSDVAGRCQTRAHYNIILNTRNGLMNFSYSSNGW